MRSPAAPLREPESGLFEEAFHFHRVPDPAPAAGAAPGCAGEPGAAPHPLAPSGAIRRLFAACHERAWGDPVEATRLLLRALLDELVAGERPQPLDRGPHEPRSLLRQMDSGPGAFRCRVSAEGVSCDFYDSPAASAPPAGVHPSYFGILLVGGGGGPGAAAPAYGQRCEGVVLMGRGRPEIRSSAPLAGGPGAGFDILQPRDLADAPDLVPTIRFAATAEQPLVPVYLAQLQLTPPAAGGLHPADPPLHWFSRFRLPAQSGAEAPVPDAPAREPRAAPGRCYLSRFAVPALDFPPR